MVVVKADDALSVVVVAGTVKLAVSEVEEVDNKLTGGRDDAEEIPTVLRTGSRVLVLAVASGPIVKGNPNKAHSWATEEKVAGRVSRCVSFGLSDGGTYLILASHCKLRMCSCSYARCTSGSGIGKTIVCTVTSYQHRCHHVDLQDSRLGTVCAVNIANALELETVQLLGPSNKHELNLQHTGRHLRLPELRQCSRIPEPPCLPQRQCVECTSSRLRFCEASKVLLDGWIVD